MNSTNFGFNLPSGTDFYNVEDFNANFQTIDEQMCSLATTKSVSANANLNDYKSVGVYKIDNSVVAGLSNCPIKSGYGLLKVERMFSTDGVIQTLYWRDTLTTDMRVYRRSYLSASYSWGKWKTSIESGVYRTLAETNLVTSDSTTSAIGNAMVNGSTVTFYHNSSHSPRMTDAPTTLGVVTLWKLPTGSFTGVFQGGNGVIYYKPYDSNTWQPINSYMNTYVTAVAIDK